LSRGLGFLYKTLLAKRAAETKKANDDALTKALA
jgi:hypothetical protein